MGQLKAKTTRKSRLRGKFRLFGPVGSTVTYAGKRWRYAAQPVTRKEAKEIVDRLRKKGYITRTLRNPLTWDILVRKRVKK